MAIGVGLEAYGVIADERAAVKAEQARAERRRSITQEVLGQADGILADALRTVGDSLDEVFKPEFQRIDAMANEIHGARTTRSDIRQRLATVEQRASATLGGSGRLRHHYVAAYEGGPFGLGLGFEHKCVATGAGRS